MKKTAATQNRERSTVNSKRWRKFIKESFKFPVCCSLFTVLSCRAVFASGEPDAWTLPGVGARPLGMGGAFIGVADGLETLYYNPAGLANLKKPEFTAMYQAPSLDASRSYLAGNYAWSTERLPGSAALGWYRLASNDIEITSDNEQVLGTDDLTNDLLLLGAGTKVLDDWSLGMNLKCWRYAFHGFSQSGVGLDAGAHGIWGPWRLGLVMTDLGGTMVSGDSTGPSGQTVKDKIPARFRAGGAFDWRRPFGWATDVTLATDLVVKMQGGQETRFYTGLESWWMQRKAAARFGYQQFEGPTFGGGLVWGPLQFDYAFLLSLNLKDEHRLGLTIRFK